jgi:hypothetical protein
MSTATKVPETWELTGDDARKTLQETGRRRLVRDAFVRLRAADGFSHARSLAFVTSLVLVQGLIALVGFTTAFDLRIGREIVAGIQSAVPGPAGHLLTSVVAHAREVGVHHRYLPLLLGLVGTLITGTTAMGQIERGFNRIYGIEKDRPTAEKYGRAFLLTLGAGSGLALAFFVFALGRRSDTANSFLHSTWPWVRWPLGLAVALLALSAPFAGLRGDANPRGRGDVQGLRVRRRLGPRHRGAQSGAQRELELRRPTARWRESWRCSSDVLSAIAIFFGAPSPLSSGRARGSRSLASSSTNRSPRARRRPARRRAGPRALRGSGGA